MEVVTVGQPAWRVIDVLDDAYEIADGWCAEPSFEAARRDTGVFLDELADTYGVVRLADVTLSDDEAGSLPWLKDWLIYLGYEVRDEFVLLKTASLNDMAAAILSIEGAPLTFDELHQKIGRGAPGSLRNQVSTDPTFTKVDREHFALAEWGMEGYTNIRGEIGKLLEQAERRATAGHGGPIPGRPVRGVAELGCRVRGKPAVPGYEWHRPEPHRPVGGQRKEPSEGPGLLPAGR